MGEALIELRGVGFMAQNSRIVEDLSLKFAAGTAAALAGPSGSGKSTVLKLAAGTLLRRENRSAAGAEGRRLGKGMVC
jgi:ABC-type molybdenum transport system ATPase subunit/photorepair protein PhrA